jgi:hypothetical protein
MIAAVNTKFSSRIWILSLLDILDMGSINANGDIVFGFACHGTRVTTDTGPIIDNEAKIYHVIPSIFQGAEVSAWLSGVGCRQLN